jgi:hypothetical protein
MRIRHVVAFGATIAAICGGAAACGGDAAPPPTGAGTSAAGAADAGTAAGASDPAGGEPAGSGPAGSEPDPLPDPCKLASVAEVSAATGKPMALGTPKSTVGYAMHYCEYWAVVGGAAQEKLSFTVAVLDIRQSAADFSHREEESVAGGNKTHPLTGIGDAAYWFPAATQIDAHVKDVTYQVIDSTYPTSQTDHDRPAPPTKLTALATTLAGRI